MRLSRISRFAGLTAATLALLAGTARGQSSMSSGSDQAATEPENELASIRRQLVEIDQRIDAVEKQALQKEGPSEAEAEYVAELKEAAIEQSPAIEEKFERQDALIAELRGNPQLGVSPEERTPEFVEKLDEFKGLRNEINPVVQSVSSEPDVQESYQAFQQAVVEKMNEIEPQTDQLLAQRAELADRFQELSNGAQ